MIRLNMSSKLEPTTQINKRTVFLLSSASAFIAGLCCFSPLIIVLLGLGTTTLAGSLATNLYENYKWYFRSVGLMFLAGSYYIWYRRRSSSCSLDQKKRLQKKMLNIFLISVFLFIALYIVWLYVIVDHIGVILHVWE